MNRCGRMLIRSSQDLSFITAYEATDLSKIYYTGHTDHEVEADVENELYDCV